MAKIVIVGQETPDSDESPNPKTAGIWAQCNDGSCVGLVADEGTGPYLCLYPAKAKGVPALAIAVAPQGDAVLQLPGPDKDTPVRVVHLNDLFDALNSLEYQSEESAKP